MGWGELRTPQGERLKAMYAVLGAGEALAERVREYLSRPTTGNREAVDAALTNYDERSAAMSEAS